MESQNWTYIKYPVSVSEHYSTTYNKHIYIFGDYHSKDMSCPKKSNSTNTIDLPTFLKNLTNLKNTDGSPKFIDFFFEYPDPNKYINNKEISFEGYFQYIHDTFKNYLNKISNIDNARFHHTNIRIISEIRNLIYPFYYYEPTRTLNIVLLKRVFTNTDNYIDNILKLTKINKQIQNITNPSIRKIIKDELETPARTKIKQITLEHIEKLKNNMFNRDLASFIYINLKDCFSLIMDMYLFARIFRNFEIKTNTYSNQPKNIIIYVGENHAERYRIMLKTFYFSSGKTIKSQKFKKDYQCVKVVDIQQPFFSKI